MMSMKKFNDIILMVTMVWIKEEDLFILKDLEKLNRES